MTTLRNAAMMALEALDCIYSPLHVREIDKVGKAMNALRAALKQPDHTEQNLKMVATCKNSLPVQQEPVAWMSPTSDSMIGKVDVSGAAFHIITTSRRTNNNSIPLYTAPLKREWQGLTDEEIEDEWERITGHSIFGGNKADGRAMYLAPDEVTEFTRAIEAKLKEKNT